MSKFLVQTDMSVKIKDAINAAYAKGVRVERIGYCSGWYIYPPGSLSTSFRVLENDDRIRVAGAARLIKELEKYM